MPENDPIKVRNIVIKTGYFYKRKEAIQKGPNKTKNRFVIFLHSIK
tara:strand:+ start:474 stop:611 length:138 start_codon:yes stop_codon:yes gene_type:complete